ncbi:MAG: carboxyl-terminal processing protease, partial [Thermoleophilaceae bacterium]|nr:carboxyl-terminal processing protease [Thermoleophilaceae bacterium]
MNPRFRTPAIASASAVVALCIGLFLGGHSGSLPTVLREIFVEDNVATRAQLINDVKDNFYKPVKSSALEQASLKGIVSSLHDRYSEYFTPTEAKAFTQNLNGQFEGVGMTIDSRDTKKGLIVSKVFPDSPAKAAGIGPGDLIVAVNGKTALGVAADVSTGMIRGPAGTSVQLTIRRRGTGPPRTVKVPRKRLNLPLVTSREVTRNGKKLAVIRLLQFSQGAHTEVRNAVQKALKDGAKGLVLDLRGNPGGELTEGRDVPSLFIKKGLIVYTRGRNSPEQKLYATGDALAPTIPMVVLVDMGSASAAEIAAGALRDTGRATI